MIYRDKDGLRIDREVREIQQKVRLATTGDALRFEFSGIAGVAGSAMEDSDGSPAC